jgi:hypothetical protein
MSETKPPSKKSQLKTRPNPLPMCNHADTPEEAHAGNRSQSKSSSLATAPRSLAVPS